jgi:HPt (histidine-containing phosphotransfer) domain-containing protein
MIDKENFKENFKYYGNEVVVQVLDIFLDEYSENLSILQKSIIELDFEKLDQKAHALKGVVAYMSEELSALCFELEQKGKDKIGEGLQPIYDQLDKGIREMVVELKVLRMEYV